jgi:response regulator RpfG family c-di-GMP phosphodiesterase
VKISEILTDGYEVITAKRKLALIKPSKKCKFDLIICDIMMPVLDGYGVTFAFPVTRKPTKYRYFLTAKPNVPISSRKGMEWETTTSPNRLVRNYSTLFKSIAEKRTQEQVPNNISGLDNLVKIRRRRRARKLTEKWNAEMQRARFFGSGIFRFIFI